jgi:hypothetical protein
MREKPGLGSDRAGLFTDSLSNTSHHVEKPTCEVTSKEISTLKTLLCGDEANRGSLPPPREGRKPDKLQTGSVQFLLKEKSAGKSRRFENSLLGVYGST